jgi:hypothetical protein
MLGVAAWVLLECCLLPCPGARSSYCAISVNNPLSAGLPALQWPKSCGHVRNKRVVERAEAVARIKAACDARCAACGSAAGVLLLQCLLQGLLA